MRELGVAAVQRYNHELAWNAGQEMARRWNSSLLGPRQMIGTMVTVPLPPQLGTTPEDGVRLRDALLFEDNIEIHLYAWKGSIRLRICAQIYNELSDISRLTEAIGRRL